MSENKEKKTFQNRKRKNSKNGNNNVNDCSKTGNGPNNNFPPHYVPEMVTRGLTNGTLVSGTLRINPRSYKDGYVSNEEFCDFYIGGIRNRNRALHGDGVILEILPEKEWNVLTDKVKDFLETAATETDFKILVNREIKLNEEGGRRSSTDSPPNPVEKKVKKKKKKAKKDLKETVNNPEPWGRTPTQTPAKWNTDELPAKPAAVMVNEGINVISMENNLKKKKKTRRSKRKKQIVIVSPEQYNESVTEPEMGLSAMTVTTTSNIDSTVSCSSSSARPIPSTMSFDSIKLELNNIIKKESDKENFSDQEDTDEYNETDDDLPDVIIEAVDGQPVEMKKKKRPRKKKKKKDFETLKKSVIQDPQIEFPLNVVMKHPKWEKFVQKTARVVRIVEKNHSRIAAGTLKLFPDKNQRFALFSPNDSRMPRMKIPMNETPDNFFSRSKDYENTLFVAKIKEWDLVSNALGTLTKTLGDKNCIENRTEGLLIEHGIDDSDFSPEVLNCLPKLPWSIPEEEYDRRRDFRQDLVFTIDPLTARDLDDALSVTDLGNNKYKVGVHIADVSYFVPEFTALDETASKRATSVYLVQRVIPMLPRPLCEHLCSLNPGEDRLTFSVEWVMSESGEISDVWFGKSVIRSATKLAYEHAQSMLDNPDRKWNDGELPEIESPWTCNDVSQKVNMLQKIAVNLRNRRFESGALRLDQPKISFTLDSETGLPQGYKVYEYKDSNRLIEEFMLLANITVATKILDSFPELAVLRRHPDPKAVVLDNLIAQLSQFDIHINPKSSKTFQRSLKKLQPTNCEDKTAQARYSVIMALCSKPMELAEYFCAGSIVKRSKFRHYALNIPIYTHFTSPIRRYPDILVHRLLHLAVKNEKPPTQNWKPNKVQKLAKNCNTKRYEAKQVSEISAECYLALFVRECGPLQVKGLVVEVKDHSIDVFISEMGVVKRVYMDRLIDFKSNSYSKNKGITAMDLIWKNGKSLRVTMLTEVSMTLTKHEEKQTEFIAIIDPPA